MSVTSREAALNALERFRKSGMRSENALDTVLNSTDLSRRDSALTAKIFYTVIQNLYYIDAVIAYFSSTPIKKLHPKVLDILRLGCCQIIFLDRVPDFSAVNEAVSSCKKSFPKAAGFVNAVCRKISAEKENLPEFGNTAEEKLSIRYSHPLWLVKYLLGNMPYKDVEALLEANNQTPPVYLHYNPLKCTVGEFYNAFYDDSNAVKHPKLEGCMCYNGFGMTVGSTAFTDGMFYVQDPAAKMAIAAAKPKAGDTVIDVCSAPGGKSIAAALMMNNTGKIYAFDISEKKLPKISESAKRLGISIITAEKADGRQFIPDLAQTADVVIADVPCSGFGVIRKKPEIRYKDYAEIEGLPKIQLAILNNAARYVKIGGTLLYSTCTILKEENENIVTAFLRDNICFAAEEFELPIGKSNNGMMTLFPHIHETDGFFICKLRRVK